MLFEERLKKCNFDIQCLKNASVMITGATGLIGKTSAICLANLSLKYNLGIHLVLLVRDESKLDAALKNPDGWQKTVVQGDIVNFKDVDCRVDYIIHCASYTSSKAFVDNPVEVIMTNIKGTDGILDFARRKGVKSVVYLSSMEAYGFTSEETELAEDNIQYLNPLAVRSSYPESKKMSENLCVSYFNEYNVPVKIVRLAQTFGKGVMPQDKRVFAEFARCAIQNKDIVLLTDGKSKRMYLDVEDAVTAILSVMFKGENGTAYNAANPSTYCSISEMAELVARTIGKDKISVKYQPDADKAVCFSPPHKYFLNVTRLKNLGWQACSDLVDIYKEMVDSWKQSM